jgi:hypothetical protein
VGTQLKLRVEDPSTPLSPDFIAQTVVPGTEGTRIGTFNLNGRFDVTPNMILMVSGVYTSKIILVDPVEITDIDPDQDTISGITRPDNWMWMWFEPSCCREILADPTTGLWSVDYSVPGPGGEPIADIGLGSSGAIHVPSGDGRTSVAWAEPDPEIGVWYQDDLVEALNWPLGTPLLLQIENPATQLSPDYSMETVVRGSLPSAAIFNVKGQFDIQPGMTVRVYGEYMSRSIVVDNLTIMEIDQVEDTITGTTAPNNWMWMYFEPSCCRPIVANSSGIWTVDYSVPGPNGEPIADIHPGSFGAIHVPGGEGRTSLKWAVSLPIQVYIGTLTNPVATHSLSSGESTRQSYTGLNNGPVKITNAQNIPIIAAERIIYKANGVNTSFSEMMGLPASQVDKVYWLPWYNNVDLDTQLRIANVTGAPATVRVYIGGQEMSGSPFTLAPGASTRKSFTGINNGPVKIQSNQNIVAAERLIYKVNNANASFSEMMALPNNQVGKIFWLPWYNNRDLDTQLRFANVSSSPATVHVYIGGQEMTGSPFMLTAGESIRKSFPGVNSGPVKIVSNENIVAAERLIYKVNGINTSFSEIMALPNSQLNTSYWLPWYNSTGELDTQLRFANVSNSIATVHIFIGGLEVSGSPFTLLEGESTRRSFPGINTGPVQIVSNQNIVAAERVIYKVKGTHASFTEMMALPESQLNATFWLPWYNNVDIDTQLRFGVP